MGVGLLLRDFDEHRFQRRVFQSSFKSDAMSGYTRMMAPLIQDHLHDWGSDKNFLCLPRVKHMLLDITAAVFFGIDDLGEDARKLNQSLVDIAEKGMMSLFQVDLPGFNFHRGMQAKTFLPIIFIHQLIPIRRKGNGQDFMSYVVKERNEDGDYFEDQDFSRTFNLFNVCCP